MKRLLVFILIFAIFLCFIVLNLENKSDVSLGFRIFNDIPVFISTLFAFALGMLVAIPLAFSMGKGRKTPPPPKPSKKAEKAGTPSVVDEIKKEKSSYGID